MALIRTTAGFHPSQRFAAWRDVIAHTYMAVDMSRLKWEGPFNGQVEIVSVGAIELSRMTVTGSRVAYRKATHIARGGGDKFFVTLPLKGRISYSHCGRDVILDTDSLYLVDANQPTRATYPDEHQVINVSIPGNLLRTRVGVPEDYCGRRLPADSGAAQVAKTLIISLFEEADKIRPDLLTEFGERVVDLVALALTAGTADLGEASRSVRWAHLLRAQRYIEAHLADPDFHPQAIANELGVSVRYMGKIFELSKQTAGEWILQRRLERTHRALADPSFAHRAISEIAYSAGFNNYVHFSHAFRRRYGTSPRQFRVGARIARQASSIDR
jgi:AraC-like DNA-binding protein